MAEKSLIYTYKRENLRFFRRYLGLTQKEFISQFLSDEAGKAMISIATLSNLEAKGGARLNDVILAVTQSLSIDSMIFSMKPESFAEQIDMFLPNSADVSIRKSEEKKGKVNELIYRLTMYFAEQIFDKKLKKGDKIESDRVLAVKFNVGRSVVREALKVLDVLGMIDIRPGQGTYISSNESNFFIIPLSWSLFLNATQISNILVIRNMLEIKGAELAAQCRQNDLLAKLHDAVYHIQTAYTRRNYREFLEGDLEFHLSVAECSQNPVIYSMIQTIQNLMKHVSGTGMADVEQLEQIYEEHKKIYGLILAQDGEGAGKAMKEHLDKSMKRYNYR